jgi:hypothetical protein
VFRCRCCATVWEDAKERCPFCSGRRIDERYTPSPYADQIRGRILGYLDPLTDRLVASLAEISQKVLSEETYLLEFEIHFNGRRFPIRWDGLDVTNGQLEDDGGYVLGRSEPEFPKEFFDTPEYADVDLPDFCYRVIEDWIANAWQRAGGLSCRYPAYVRAHGSGVAFDLRERRLVKNSQRWPDS